MGQVPPKFMYPSAPYGSSDAVNALNAVQPPAVNPQQPLLPPNFQDRPTMNPTGAASPLKTNPLSQSMGMRGLPNYRRMYNLE